MSRSSRGLFVNRNVFRLWSGQIVSQTGNSVFRIALLWLLLEMTGSKAITGAVVMCGTLPSLILGFFTGALVDRFDRRRTMLAADLARAGLVLMIPLLYYLGGLTVALIGALTFATATFNTLFLPARDTLVGQLVERDDRLAANAMIQTSWQFAILIGPVIAGIALIYISEIHLFALDAATYLISFFFIYRISLPQREKLQGNGRKLFGEFGRIAHDAKAGVVYIVADRRLRVLLFITAIDNLFLMGPAHLGAPIFVRDRLQLGAEYYAFVGIATAIGMIVSTAILNRLGSRLRNSRVILFGIVFDGLTFIPMLFVDSFAGMFVTMAIHALAIPMIIVCRPTIIQNVVPPQMQGRVFSLISVAVFGFTSLSTVITGVIAEIVPIQYIYAGSGILAASTGVLGWTMSGFRELDQGDH